MEEKIKSILCEMQNIEPENITLKTNLIRDIEMSSVEVMNLCGVLEEEYAIEILDEDLITIQTVEDLINYVGQKMEEKV
ncbi:phosphopantetheine-binding protein [Anaerocolumna sp. AGMB13025]|uniref:acyl carrier protein n=1 Tax=Anaerocolumna sp. AGMB13025 TaxID=3039116 RepID=UPI00241D0613|nr:phosphopantetheine-binding protein [Anaerocolumna sp. AGMB13025]WFR56040.1 phosphopantetheine-binding protein [Anaerocolumna sp. AGMB13025]